MKPAQLRKKNDVWNEIKQPIDWDQKTHQIRAPLKGQKFGLEVEWQVQDKGKWNGDATQMGLKVEYKRKERDKEIKIKERDKDKTYLGRTGSKNKALKEWH